MKPLPDGSGTNQDAYDSIKRQTGREPPEARPPCEPPEPLNYLWRWFWEMNRGRTSSPAGLGAIPNAEILAWAQLRNVSLHNWELRTVMSLDATFLRVMGEK